MSRSRDYREWVRTQHTDGCRRCQEQIVWFTWARERTPTPEAGRRTLCSWCLAKAFAGRVSRGEV